MNGLMRWLIVGGLMVGLVPVVSLMAEEVSPAAQVQAVEAAKQEPQPMAVEETASPVGEETAGAPVPVPAVEIPAAQEPIPVSPFWKEFPPKFEIIKWGPEIRIKVYPHSGMSKEEVEKIKSVRFESETGEFLGLRSFSAEEVDRMAEFAMNPEIIKIDKAKFTIISETQGTYVEIISLANPMDPAAAAPVKVEVPEVKSEQTAAAEQVEKTVEPAPKEDLKNEDKKEKKGWHW